MIPDKAPVSNFMCHLSETKKCHTSWPRWQKVATKFSSSDVDARINIFDLKSLESSVEGCMIGQERWCVDVDKQHWQPRPISMHNGIYYHMKWEAFLFGLGVFSWKILTAVITAKVPSMFLRKAIKARLHEGYHLWSSLFQFLFGTSYATDEGTQ